MGRFRKQLWEELRQGIRGPVQFTENKKITRKIDPRTGRERQRRDTYVYFIQCEIEDGPIKIGKTSITHFAGGDRMSLNRLQELQVGCPYKLKVLHSIRAMDVCEFNFHSLFSKDHIRGEWFQSSETLLKTIEEIKHLEEIRHVDFDKRTVSGYNSLRQYVKFRVDDLSYYTGHEIGKELREAYPDKEKWNWIEDF